MLEKQRCPWCGNEFVSKSSFRLDFHLDKYLIRCNVCGRYSKHVGTLPDILSLLLVIILLLFAQLIGIYPYIAASILNIMCFHKSPYKRQPKVNEKIPEEPVIGDAIINWFS